MITIPQFLDFATDTDNTEIVQGFLKLLELKSHGLFLHSQQVANYAAATAIKMGLPLSEVNGIKTAALLHDIGQLAIPNIILANFYDRKSNPCTRQWQIAGCKSPQVIRDLTGVKFDPDAVQAFFASISNPG